MSSPRQWLDLGLDALPPEQAARVRLFRQLQAAAAMLRRRLDQAMAASGVTTQQAALLQFIEAQPAAPTMGQVAQSLGMSHQNVKQIAVVLARKGFVEITVDTVDRRARRLCLTDHHHRFWRQRSPDDFAQVEAWTAALDGPAVQQLNALLGPLIASLAEAPDPTAPESQPAPPDNPGA